MSTKNQKLLQHPAINDSGFLDVGDGHKIYWVDWGNKAAEEPIFFLHGGPGGGVDADDFDKFDPKVHRVIFHDQRSSGRSTPYCSIEDNTTAHLVGDIDKLRGHLSIDKLSFYGGSWGATLALVYAVQHPGNVNKMLLNAVYLARDEDRKFFIGGETAGHFPEAWGRFRSLAKGLPDEQVADHYKEVMFGDDAELSKKYAYEWTLYEASMIGLNYDLKATEKMLESYFVESLAKLEAYYILNDCYIEEDYIIKNAAKLKDINITIVQGRQDFVCKPAAAIGLVDAIRRAGGNPNLHMLPVGHWVRETPVGKETLKAHAASLWR